MLSPGNGGSAPVYGHALGHVTYERHCPEQTLLYRLMEKHYPAADIMSHKLALWMAQLLLALGYALLAIAPDYGLVILACMSIGLAAGGMLPVWGALTAEIFGLTSYGRAFGLMGPIIMIFVMVGFPLTGRLYDITGSFALCLWIYTGLMVVAAALLMPLRLPKKAA